jgi:hypothetical protein
MAESGQQPTVDATLVNDIFEMLMEMDIRKIDIRLQRQYFDRPAQLTTTGSQCGAPAQIYVAAAEDSAKSQQCTECSRGRRA